MGEPSMSNSDPITGQAAWYDVRVRIRRAEADEPAVDLAAIRGGPGGARHRRDVRVTGILRRSPEVTQLALVIDLNVCVGCQACVTSCKEWNTSGSAGPLADLEPYGKDPSGAFFNRVQTFEVGEFPNTQTVHFPKSCLHCEDPPCVPVCPTGASYKRAEDGIVLVDYDKCIGCKYCAWACPYGAREIEPGAQGDDQVHAVRRPDPRPALPEADRKPACVSACPTNARLFGDIHDPDSVVSRAIRESARLRADAGVGNEAREPLSAATADTDARPWRRAATLR